jgi:hypothetical protein
MADDDDMTFAEFKTLMLQDWPFADDGVEGELRAFLKTGCTEEEAKIWIGERIWKFPDGVREKLVQVFAAEAFHQAARKAPPQEEEKKDWKVWKICAAHKQKVRPDLWKGLTARKTEEEGRAFLADHLKELPKEMQDGLVMLFFEEGLGRVQKRVGTGKTAEAPSRDRGNRPGQTRE